MKQFVVVGAVIVHHGRVLCARRAQDATLAGMWEFPGGKVEPSESPEEALQREIAEELRCLVEVGAKVTTKTHAYDFAVVQLTTYYCRLTGGVAHPAEHAELAWLDPHELLELEWAPADIPAVQLVTAALKGLDPA